MGLKGYWELVWEKGIVCLPSSLAVAEEIMMSRPSLCIFVDLPVVCPNGARCTASSGPSFPMFLEVGLMTRQQLCLKSS